MKLLFPPHEPREVITLPLSEPVLVRLSEDVGRLPAPFVYQLPREHALRLVRQRLATVVPQIGATPDVVIDEDEIDAALSTVETIQA